MRGHTEHNTLVHQLHNACDRFSGLATELPEPAAQPFPFGEEEAVIYDHHGNIVQDGIRPAVRQRCQSLAFDRSRAASEKNNTRPSPFLACAEAAQQCKPTARAWASILRGNHGQGLMTFLCQARANRLTAYDTVHKFNPRAAPSPMCPHCPEERDTVSHRLLLCPSRLEKACQLRTDIAHRLAKGSNHQWPTEAPPDVPSLRALLHAHWGKKITLRSTEPPAKNPLNVASPYDETDGLHISSNDAVKDGTFNPDFYKHTNPITPAEIEARKFALLPKKGKASVAQDGTERILQIQVAPPRSEHATRRAALSVTN